MSNRRRRNCWRSSRTETHPVRRRPRQRRGRRDGKAAELEHEPTPAETLKRGVDLICFSGDKLFGGPQAGIIAGKARLVGCAQTRTAFSRAALRQTDSGRAANHSDLFLAAKPPRFRAGCVPALKRRNTAGRRTDRPNRDLPLHTIEHGNAQIGGGRSASVITSVTLDFESDHISSNDLAARLRRVSSPVIGYVAAGSAIRFARRFLRRQGAGACPPRRHQCAIMTISTSRSHRLFKFNETLPTNDEVFQTATANTLITEERARAGTDEHGP